MARLEMPVGDPVYAHVVRCSPCFREMRALQQTRRPARGSRTWIAAAAIVALIVGAWWWMAGSPRDATVVAVTIDLRPFVVTRGNAQPPPPPPVAIPRARLYATILLPLGAEAGTYEVQLRDDAMSARASVTGEAEISETVTMLRVSLDATILPAAAYDLGVRPLGGEWRHFPARLK